MKINYGCGMDHKTGYMNVDMDPACKPDALVYGPDDLQKFKQWDVTEIFAKDVLEHIPRTQTMTTLLELAALLPIDGLLDLQTTSVTHVLQKIADSADFEDHHNWLGCLFGNQAHAGDFHFTGFTETSLRVFLYVAGFDISGPVELVDGWMMRVNAVKQRDWTVALEHCSTDTVEVVRTGFRSAFGREAGDHDILHWTPRFRAENPRHVLREMFNFPEAIYNAGKLLRAPIKPEGVHIGNDLHPVTLEKIVPFPRARA